MTETESEILNRMQRMESRLCQLMMHVGLNPQVRQYDTPRREFNPNVWKFSGSKLVSRA